MVSTLFSPSQEISTSGLTAALVRTLPQVLTRQNAKTLLLAYALYALFKYRQSAYGVRPRPELKGPPGWPLIGNLLDQIRTPPNQLLQRQVANHEKYGSVYTATFPGVGRIINIIDPEMVDHMLRGNFWAYEKGPVAKTAFEPLLGNGIFSADGEHWKWQRKLASQIFSVKAFRHYTSDVFCKEGHIVIDYLNSAADSGRVVDLQQLFYCYTLDSFGEIAYGKSFGCLVDPEKEVAFAAAFDRLNTDVAERPGSAYWRFKDWWTGKGDQIRKDSKLVRDFARGIIQERRKQDQERDRQGDKAPRNKDLLQLFMDLSKEGDPLSDDMLMDSVLNFIVAGRDTTAQALSWTFYLLHRSSTSPDILERLVKETDDVLAGGLPSYESVKHQKYAEACFHEALRLYPSVSKNGKTCVEDDILPGGIKVYKGDRIGWSSYAMGRALSVWGSDAKEFKPERWMNGDKPSSSKFISFHHGPRTCLGQQFATIEAITLMSMLVQHFTFELVDPNNEPAYLPSLTLPMERGLPILVKRRVSAPAVQVEIPSRNTESYALYALFKYRQSAYGVRPRPELKGPPGWPLIGNLLDRIRTLPNQVLQQQVANHEKYGSVYTATFPGVGRIINIIDPEMVDHMLRGNFWAYEKGPTAQMAAEPLLGNGIFSADGEHWKWQRKLASQIFSVKAFRHYTSDVFCKEGQIVIDYLNSAADSGRVVDLQQLFYCYTLDSFGEIAYGKSFGCLVDPEKEVAFAAAFDRLNVDIADRQATPTTVWRIKDLLTGKGDQITKDSKLVKDFARDIIQERRRQDHENEGQEDQEPRNKDLLQLFMDISKEGDPLSDDMLIDSVLNFVVAGRDTTAQALSWTFYLLHRSSTSPDILERLVKETDDVLAGGLPSYESVKNQKYAEACFIEALRLYPSVPSNYKTCVEDDVLPGGIQVHKGDIVEWSSYAMGRSSSLWGPDAKEFKPERWLSGEKPSSSKFIAFHHGPRTCLGQQFATIEAITLMSMLVQHFTFELVDPNNEPAYLPSLTLPMDGGLRIRVKRRATAAAVNA
ncbi:serine/threonine protein kinase, CMGC, dual-specificity [Mortierella alpina]|nr:serine/threonine protein kinase, CMGC, dual-specificity [Mortierella alpina]